MTKTVKAVWPQMLALLLAALLPAHALSPAVLAVRTEDTEKELAPPLSVSDSHGAEKDAARDAASLAAAQTEAGPGEPHTLEAGLTETVRKVTVQALDANGNTMEAAVDEYTYAFSQAPATGADMARYQLDSPYKAMALLVMAFRTWTPDNEKTCLEMLDCLTNTGSTLSGTGEPFSRYSPWISALRDRMVQNSKYQYIGNAYLKGATPDNNYTPTEPYTVTLRQSVHDPYKAAEGGSPELKQILIHTDGADSERYSLFYQDQQGIWRVFGDNWMGLLADVKPPVGSILYPAEVVRSASPAQIQAEPELKIEKVDGFRVDENGSPIPIQLDQYTFTFSTVPQSYEDLVQYKLDSPYKTMALLFLAFRTWTPGHPEVCAHMLDYLTNPAVEKPGARDQEGHSLSYAFSEYNPWLSFLKERMTQNNKYQFIGNAYLKGAAPSNNYTPTDPLTVVVRQSAYDPYKARTDTTPELQQVLVSLEGADSDRYALFYQDQRGDWRVFGDNWMGLLADVREAVGGPAILGATLDGSRVAFRVENDGGKGLAFAASYLSDGTMASCAGAEAADGIWTAQAAPSCVRCQILLLDRDTLRPLCKSVWIAK